MDSLASVAQMNSSECLISRKTPKLQIIPGTFPMWEVSSGNDTPGHQSAL